MNAKWYISTLFLALIYFGAFQEPISTPNQEIVLKFVDSKINEKEITNTIIDVKEKLLKVGVSNIKIQETQSGTLKISYYSIVDIDNIKEALAKENQLVLNQKSNNKERKKTSSDYKIDVYDLTDTSDFSTKDDKFVFEIKYNSDRFTTNYNPAFFKNNKTHKADQLYKTAFKANKNCPFTKDHTSHQEPEVRAGPDNIYF